MLAVVGSRKKLEDIRRLMSKQAKNPNHKRIRNQKFRGVSQPSLPPTKKAKTMPCQQNFNYFAFCHKVPAPDELTYTELVQKKKTLPKSLVDRTTRLLGTKFFDKPDSLLAGEHPQGIHVPLKVVLVEALHDMDAVGEILPTCMVPPPPGTGLPKVILHWVLLSDGSPFHKSTISGVTGILLDPFPQLIKCGHSGILVWFLGSCKEEWVSHLLPRMNQELGEVYEWALVLPGCVVNFRVSFSTNDYKMTKYLIRKTSGENRCLLCPESVRNVGSFNLGAMFPYEFLRLFVVSLCRILAIGFQRREKLTCEQQEGLFKEAQSSHGLTGWPFFVPENKLAFAFIDHVIAEYFGYFKDGEISLPSEKQTEVLLLRRLVFDVSATVTKAPAPSLTCSTGYPIEPFLLGLPLNHGSKACCVGVLDFIIALSASSAREQQKIVDTCLALISPKQVVLGLYEKMYSYNCRRMFSEIISVLPALNLRPAFEQFTSICHVVFTQMFSHDLSAWKKALFEVACLWFTPLIQFLATVRYEPHGTAKDNPSKDIAKNPNFPTHMVKHMPDHQRQISIVVGKDVPLATIVEGPVDLLLGKVKKMLTACSSGSTAADLDRAYQQMLELARAERQGFLSKEKHRPSQKKYKEVAIDFLAFDPRFFRTHPTFLTLKKAIESRFLKQGEISSMIHEVGVDSSGKLAVVTSTSPPGASLQIFAPSANLLPATMQELIQKIQPENYFCLCPQYTHEPDCLRSVFSTEAHP